MRARIDASFRQLSSDRAEEVGMARFFRNPKVKKDEMLETAAQRTASAAVGRHVLILQDTSEINYQAKAERKRGLGKVGNGEDVGLFVHPALAVDAETGAALGIAGATIWRRTKTKALNYQSLPIEDKESFRWIDTAKKARAALSEAAMVTVIADREADIYELFARVPDARTHVLVRAEHDRALKTGGRLHAALEGAPEAGRIDFPLEARPGRPKRNVTLAVRFKPVALRRPSKGADDRDPPALRLYAVEAREIDPPPGEKPILWRLLTTHEIGSLADAARMIDFYRMRWNIEQLFRTLKSAGLDIEECLLADGEALENVAVVALIAACQVMQLVRGRGVEGQTQDASLVFSSTEIHVLKAVIKQYEGKTEKQKNRFAVGSLAWAAWAIARLGGWKGYASERPPGPITFTHGLRRFQSIFEGYRLAQNGLPA
jgi:Transposase DDE domain